MATRYLDADPKQIPVQTPKVADSEMTEPMIVEPSLPDKKTAELLMMDTKSADTAKTVAKGGETKQTGEKKEGTEEEKEPTEPPPPPEPFDSFVQKVIDSVTDKIKLKSGIQRDRFEGLSFCQYVCEEMAYYVKFHQVDELYFHVKITKPFIPMLQETWEVPFEVEEVRMDQKDDEKVRVWDKPANTLDRDRKNRFYTEEWDKEDKELGISRPRIDHRFYEKEAELRPV